jgi:putative membrane protein
MKNTILAAALSLMAGSALAQTAPQEFVDKAASSGLYEIESSRIVLADAATDAELQAFAKQMIADHTKAAKDLKAATTDSGLTASEALLPRHASMLNELGQSGDRATVYQKQQLDAHEEAVALHQAYGSAGTDANLKAYADATSPVLKMHLEHIKAMNHGGHNVAGSGGATNVPATTDNMNPNAEGVDSSTSGGQGTGSGAAPIAPAN